MNRRQDRPDDDAIPRPTGEPPEVADASFLFDDEPKPDPALRRRPPTPPAAAPSPGIDEYEVAGLAPDLADPPRNEPLAPPPPTTPRRKSRPAEPDRPKGRKTVREEEPGQVSQLWSRGAEWGPTIGLLAVVAASIAAVAYFAASALSIQLALLIVVVGGALLVLLSYPIAVTLERPVRLTPEQALKDYFESLSHRWPHHLRMWLLLSDRGRESGPFESYDGFRKYWRGRVATILKRVEAGTKGPIEFEVVEFKSEEKSAGKSSIEGTATVQIRPRGGSTPVESVRYKVRFVRGNDRMWYLEDATLPESRERRRTSGPEVVDDED